MLHPLIATTHYHPAFGMFTESRISAHSMRFLSGQRVRRSIVLPVDTHLAVLAACSVLINEHHALDFFVDGTSLRFAAPLLIGDAQGGEAQRKY
jgi:hypothetical protein